MVNAKELRIGNCIYNEHNRIIEVTFQVLEAIYHNRGIYNYIPLSEKILLKYGFENVKNIRGSYELKGLRIHSQYPPPHKEELFNGVTEVYYYEHPIWCFDACKYLHKLQNLYFFLTGKELSVVANGS